MSSYVSYYCVIQPSQPDAVHFIPVNFFEVNCRYRGRVIYARQCHVFYLTCNDHELYRIIMDDPTRIVGQ